MLFTHLLLRLVHGVLFTREILALPCTDDSEWGNIKKNEKFSSSFLFTHFYCVLVIMTQKHKKHIRELNLERERETQHIEVTGIDQVCSECMEVMVMESKPCLLFKGDCLFSECRLGGKKEQLQSK